MGQSHRILPETYNHFTPRICGQGNVSELVDAMRIVWMGGVLDEQAGV